MDLVRRYCSRVAVLAVSAALVGALSPAAARADTGPDFSYWYAAAQAKVFPTTAQPAGAPLASDTTAAPALDVTAAQAEYEGRQIALRAGATGLQDVWLQPSALTMETATGPAVIPASDVTVFKIGYVNITHPSYGYSRTGLQPDPLIPMTLANGQRLGWSPDSAPDLGLRGVAAGATQPFYVLFQVPDGAAPGVYSGTVTVTASDAQGVPSPVVVVPVSLTVYPFSIAQRTIKTAFRFDAPRARRVNSASGSWLWEDPFPSLTSARVAERSTYALDQIGGWLRYMSDHRIASQSLPTAWAANGDSSGRVIARPDVLTDYLGTGTASTMPGSQLAFNAVRLPEYNSLSYLTNPFTSSKATALATTYYRSMYSALGSNAAMAYVYPVDEPSASEISFTKRYAAFVHRAIPGAKFLLTTDATTEKNRLVSGVDIYVYRLHFFFRDSAYINKIKAAHKQIWIYTHRTDWQKVTPMYLIDKPLGDSRVMGWFAFRTRAAGLLYFSIDRWRKATTEAYRDPYTDPLTTNDYNPKTGGRLYANGDGSLVYPGYYPRLGLDVQGAPPVGSLRVEALRDGLEDYEYVKLVAARYGTPAADSFVARIIGAVPTRQAGVLQFPKYKTDPSVYDDVRSSMAAELSQ